MIAIQNSPKQAARKRFALREHPWLSLWAVMIATVTSLALSGALIYGMLGLSDAKPLPQFLQPMLFHVLTGFIIAPFIIRLPKGKRTYRQYLDDIGLGGGQPWLRLIALGVTCSLILALSQAAASVIYRLTEGLPLNGAFLRRVFDLSSDLPPRSWGFFTSIPSAFEEVAFRGIVLTVFLSRYSKRTSIVYSALGFGLMHLLNLAVGREPVWVLGQVVWAFIL
ncbi:MAG: CPBP family intramembrane metalloprotease, partial [Anaerolineae bacterium]|nr:CPBP family intramembrane metalloprotease [Anaerolineae bacterium]